MVLKKRKPGACKVNTGRTIRNGPHHSSRNRYAFVTYSKDGPVEVAVRGDEKLKSVLSILPSEEVEYSLKKKGRWQISDLLKRHVVSEVHDADYEVKLCEHYHHLGCKDPCTGESSYDLSSRKVLLAHQPYAVARWDRADLARRRRTCSQRSDGAATAEDSTVDDSDTWSPSGWLSFNIVHGVRDDSSAAFIKPPRTMKQGKKSKERTVGKRDALDEALCDYRDSISAANDSDDDWEDDGTCCSSEFSGRGSSRVSSAPTATSLPKKDISMLPPQRRPQKPARRPLKYRRRKAK